MRSLLALAVLLPLAGCCCCCGGGGGGGDAVPGPAPADGAGEPLPAREIARGATSAIGAARVAVVRTPAAWSALWAEHAAHLLPPSPAPEVDFDRDMVVAVFLGQRPSGGFAVAIEECRARAGGIAVRARETRPGPDDVVTMALTAPYAMVAVPRAEGEAELELESAARR